MMLSPGWDLFAPDAFGVAPLVVLRSGDWYVIRRGDLGRAIQPNGTVTPAVPFQSLMAHVQVVEAWEQVEDIADLPASVAAVVHERDGWVMPEWAAKGDDGAEVEVKAGDAPASDIDEREARLLLVEAHRMAGVPLHAQPYSEEDKRAILHALVEIAESRMRDMAEELRAELDTETKSLVGDAKAKVQAWKGKAAKFLRRVFLAGALTLTDPMTRSDADAFQEAYQGQVAYLDKFEQQVLSEEQSTDTTGISSRAAKYAGAVWTVAENVAQEHADGAGFTEAMRILNASADHCARCPAEADKGWVKIKDCLPIGSTPCGSRCRCYLTFR